MSDQDWLAERFEEHRARLRQVAYRILGSTLLLVDRKANLIVDFIPNAIP